VHYYNENWKEIGKTRPDRITDVFHLEKLRVLVMSKSSLNLDDDELEILKGLVLFQPSIGENISGSGMDEDQIAKFFGNLLEALDEYIKSKYLCDKWYPINPIMPVQPKLRRQQILDLLKCVNTLKTSRIVEKVFFTNAMRGREDLPVTPRKRGLSFSLSTP